MINLRKLLLLILPILLAPVALLGATATEVLRHAEVADKYVSYRGNKVAMVHFGSRLTTASMKVVHQKPDLTRTEYFTPDPLAGIILIQDGSEFWRYSPKESAWQQIGRCGLASVGAIHHDALENYSVHVIGLDNVAGRPAYVIHANPKLRGESGRRLWIDKEHYVLMKIQVETPQGRVLNSSCFTSVEFNPTNINPSVFKVKGKIKHAQKSGCIRFKVLKPAYLPRGYRLVGISSINVNSHCCSHLQFSNGANVISLFQHKSAKRAPVAPIVSKVTSGLAWAKNGMQFTLLGDLSRTELQKVANSIR